MSIRARLIGPLSSGYRDTSTGLPLAGGTARLYNRDTGDPVTGYMDPDREATHPAIIPLDGGGAEDVYVDQDVLVRLYDTSGTLVHTIESVAQNVTTRDVELEQGTDSSGTIFSATELETVLRLWLTSGGAGDWKYKRASGTGVVARYIKAKLGQVVDLLDFGAVYDGTTDSAGAWTNALAALPTNGSMILLTSGSLLLASTVTIADKVGVSIIGEGGGTIIKGNGDNLTLFTVTSSTAGATKSLTFSDLTLQGAGDGTATAAVGISIAANCRRVTLERLRLTGTDGTHGFTTGISIACTTATLRNIHIEQIRNSGIGVKLDGATGILCDDVTVAGGATTGLGIGVNATGGGSGLKVVNCTVSGCVNGIVILTTDTCLVSKCEVASCTGVGILVSGASLRARVETNEVNTCATGIKVTTTATGSPSAFIIDGNTIAGCTAKGIQITTIRTTAPSNGIVSRNNVRYCAEEGIWTASDDTLFAENIVSDCSTGTIRTSAAYKVTTVQITGTEYGGSRNVFAGNIARETVATYEHLCAIDITDSAGAYANVYTTVLLPNHFPAQATSGTPCSIRFGGTLNVSGNATSAVRMMPGALGLGYDDGLYIAGTASVTLTAADSGRHYLCDDTGGNVAFTLPTLAAGAAAFVRYRITRLVAGGNTISATRGGANTITTYNSTGNTSVTVTASAGSSIEIIHLAGVWYVFQTNPVAASDSVA